MIIAIDPGTTQSAIVAWDGQKLSLAEIMPNDLLMGVARFGLIQPKAVYCEMIASYGMPVGREVFETCLLIGSLREAFAARKWAFNLVYRRDVKLHHCGVTNAKDPNIRRALLDKYGEPGTRKKPGITYGLKKDLWAAFAIAAYVKELEKLPGGVTP